MSELAWDAAHEAWAAAQLAPGEGIEDGAARVAAVIERAIAEATQDLRADRDSWIQQASDRAQDALDLVAAERERWRAALRYAVEEADGWHDESRGGQIHSPEMDAARELLAKGNV